MMRHHPQNHNLPLGLSKCIRKSDKNVLSPQHCLTAGVLVLNSSQPWLQPCLRAVPSWTGLDYSKQAEKDRVRVCLGWRPAGRNKSAAATPCSKTKGLRSAGKYRLQLGPAAGKCAMERHHTNERSHSLQPGNGQLGFCQDF